MDYINIKKLDNTEDVVLYAYTTSWIPGHRMIVKFLTKVGVRGYSKEYIDLPKDTCFQEAGFEGITMVYDPLMDSNDDPADDVAQRSLDTIFVPDELMDIPDNQEELIVEIRKALISNFYVEIKR